MRYLTNSGWNYCTEYEYSRWDIDSDFSAFSVVPKDNQFSDIPVVFGKRNSFQSEAFLSNKASLATFRSF